MSHFYAHFTFLTDLTLTQVRIGALTVLEALHSKLAEDYLSLLPETIPFLAELMEGRSFSFFHNSMWSSQ